MLLLLFLPAGAVLRGAGGAGGGGGGAGAGLRHHLAGEGEDPGRGVQEHALLAAPHHGGGGPGVALRTVLPARHLR